MLKKIPDTFVIIFFLIVIASILTWILPGGMYSKKPNIETTLNWMEVSATDTLSKSVKLIQIGNLVQSHPDSTTKKSRPLPPGQYFHSEDSLGNIQWSFSIPPDTINQNTKTEFYTLSVGGQQIKKPNSAPVFEKTNSSPQSYHIFTAFQIGFKEQAAIIIFVLIVGGVFWIVNQSRAIDAGIFSLLRRLKRLEKSSFISSKLISNIILVIIMLIFSAFGAIFGMSEETIAFVAIVIPLAISLGYDSITGVCMVFVAAGLGFAGAILNPFTIGIAQGISGLPLFSGIEYRFFCWVVLNIIGITYILLYANKVYQTPQKSPTYKLDKHWRERAVEQETIKYYKTSHSWVVFIGLQIIAIIFAIGYPKSSINLGNSVLNIYALPILAALFGIISIITLLRSVHFFVLNLLFFTILYLLIGVMGYEWYINEISGLFLALGIATGIALKKGGNQIVKHFIDGAKDILGAALIIGLAGGIIVILKDGQIIDSILNKAANTMYGLGKSGTIGVMYIIQTFLNVIIPSGSAKAAITMPIMAPFSDLVSLSRQATVVAFQFGDGFTNMITPTSGVLMAVLGVAKIPYAIWLKWVIPLIAILVVTGFLLLLPTVYMDLNGF